MPQESPDQPQRPASGNGACEPDPQTEPASAAFAQAGRLVREVADYATHMAYARIDKAIVSARNAAIYAVLGLVGLVVAATVAVTAAVLLLVGLGGAVSALLGARPWAGQLIVGLGVLIIMASIVLVGMSYITRQSRKKTVRKYEQRKQQQRINFGQDVHQRAQNARE